MIEVELESRLIDTAARNKAIADLFFSYLKVKEPPVIYNAFLKEFRESYFCLIEAQANVISRQINAVVLKKHLSLLKKVFLMEEDLRKDD